MSKKIWLSMHPRKFGNHVTVRAPSEPKVYQCEITQSTGIATQMQHEVFGGSSHGHPDFLERKNNNKIESDYIFLSLLAWITGKEVKR